VTAAPDAALPPFLAAEGVQILGSLRPLGERQPTPEVQGLLAMTPASPAHARTFLDDLARAATWLNGRLVDDGIWAVSCGERRQTTYLDPETLDTVAVVLACAAADVAVEPGAGEATRLRLSTGVLLVRVPAPEGVFAEGVQVVGARRLGVREIVARHQAAAARQRREVRTVVSMGSMTLTFEAPGFFAPMTITAETLVYADSDRVEVEQREVRVNGIAFREGSVPQLPLVEPERVAAPPLAITLGEVYRYALAGEDVVSGIPCYVVAFEPIDHRVASFAGRAWINRDSFALVRVAAAQTGLGGPIVSSEQIDEFREAAAGMWLLARSEVRQLYEGAGHRTPILRVLTIRQHDINAADFEARREAAYASRSIMLRDTPEGFRYLRREGGPGPGGVPEVAAAAARVRTIAFGAVFDPNIDRPLPFAGLSYVHFNLFGRGGQLNGFFGGTYGQLALAVPSIGGTRWQAGARAFAIASSYNDRAFVEGREIYRANISQRPAHLSAWLLRPAGRRLSARAGYDFDYTRFARTDTTAPTFRVPAAQVAHGLTLALQGQAAGLDASVWWTGATRTGWRPWGEPDSDPATDREAYDPRHKSYQRVGATVGRSWIASRRLVGRVEAAWMDGRDLDRFSRYTFGTFDNRLRGYPAALIRYDRGVVLRTTASWAAGRFLRVNGFVDNAYVRDPGFGVGARRYTGLGAALEAPGPLGTLVGVEWGHGFQGVNTDGRRGTQVVRVSGYKMF
jgi:hypothetical protein